ncbi:MAG: dihydrofolate reductase family protein [Ilumatobacteraceae bacterium]
MTEPAGTREPAVPVIAMVLAVDRTYLYGRRMYETMVCWETAGSAADEPAVFRDYAAIWRAAEKIVYSRTLQTVSSSRTRIERDLDRDAVRRLTEPSGADIAIGGAELAGRALGAGLVDECHLFVCPIVVGGGKRALPETSAPDSSSSTNAGSATASFTSTTASRGPGV